MLIIAKQFNQILISITHPAFFLPYISSPKFFLSRLNLEDLILQEKLKWSFLIEYKFIIIFFSFFTKHCLFSNIVFTFYKNHNICEEEKYLLKLGKIFLNFCSHFDLFIFNFSCNITSVVWCDWPDWPSTNGSLKSHIFIYIYKKKKTNLLPNQKNVDLYHHRVSLNISGGFVSLVDPLSQQLSYPPTHYCTLCTSWKKTLTCFIVRATKSIRTVTQQRAKNKLHWTNPDIPQLHNKPPSKSIFSHLFPRLALN